MEQEFAKIEAEQFIRSALSFISEQADRFHTTEEFIEECMGLLLELIQKERLSAYGNENLK
jgi:hypothetical protein